MSEQTYAAEVLSRAAIELRHQATLRFDIYGPHDVRGTALWDAGCHIDPDDGDALGARAAAAEAGDDSWCCRKCHDIGRSDDHPRPCNCTFTS